MDSQLENKLDVIITLLAAGNVQHLDSQPEQVVYLTKLGLGVSAISAALDAKPDTVRKAIQRARKKGELNE